jgi:hypothetical protein
MIDVSCGVGRVSVSLPDDPLEPPPQEARNVARSQKTAHEIKRRYLIRRNFPAIPPHSNHLFWPCAALVLDLLRAGVPVI